MGAADVVPGVSAGTIAFITGIYGELVDSIKSLNLSSLKTLFTGDFLKFWKQINGGLLLSLLIGISLSVISLAKVLQELLQRSPEPLWAFFFGLIVASAIVISTRITKWDIVNIISFVTGIVAAYFITILTPVATPTAYWFIFISGAITICAMLLPGISGAFMLIILGKYQFILNAFTEFKADVIAVFIAGAMFGIISCANILSWLLSKYYNATTAILAGFMVGSLNKVWPWKETISDFIDSDGEIQPLLQVNISPVSYFEATGNNPELYISSLLCIVGFLIIIVFEKIISEK